MRTLSCWTRLAGRQRRAKPGALAATGAAVRRRRLRSRIATRLAAARAPGRGAGAAGRGGQRSGALPPGSAGPAGCATVIRTCARATGWAARAAGTRRERAGPLQVVAYVPEDALPRLRAGQTARFIADGGAGPDLDLRVRSIDQTPPACCRKRCCPPRRRRRTGARVAKPALPERPVYRVMLDVESADPPAQARQHSWRGRVSIHGDWEAPRRAC